MTTVLSAFEKGSTMEEIKSKANSMSLAALIFGIIAVLGSFTVVLTPLFAGLAVTFALLSRGDKKMCGQAIAGNVLAVFAVAVSIIVLIALVVVIASFAVMPIEDSPVTDMIGLQTMVQRFYGL